MVLKVGRHAHASVLRFLEGEWRLDVGVTLLDKVEARQLGVSVLEANDVERVHLARYGFMSSPTAAQPLQGGAVAQ